MSDMSSDRATARVKRATLTLLTLIPVLMIPALEWLPWIPERSRPWLILPSLAIAGVGFILLQRNERDLAEVLSENERMKTGITKAEPEYLLKQISATLFRQGAWRLTVYRKVHSSSARPGDQLIKLASVASDGDQGDLGASQIGIQPSTMFEFYFRSNLADPTFRQPAESGHSPEDVHSDSWDDWRDGIFGKGAITDDTSTFKARKFAWYAAQDPESQTVFAAIAESAEPEGIAVDSLDHTFTPAWLLFVARLADLHDSVAQQGQPGNGSQDPPQFSATVLFPPR